MIVSNHRILTSQIFSFFTDMKLHDNPEACAACGSFIGVGTYFIDSQCSFFHTLVVEVIFTVASVSVTLREHILFTTGTLSGTHRIHPPHLPLRLIACTFEYDKTKYFYLNPYLNGT